MSFYMSKVSITQIGFALLCIGSVFMYSTQITDPYIVSKWLYTILFVLIIIRLYILFVNIKIDLFYLKFIKIYF